MGAISQFLTQIKDTIENVNLPVMTEIPAIILWLGSIGRSGLSPMATSSKIISRQAEAGAPSGPAADGTANVSEAMEKIRVEEIMDALHLTTKVQSAIPLYGVQIIGFGANEGGPVVINGYNILPAKVTGIVS